MDYDAIYKAYFSHPRTVRDLLSAFVADQIEGGQEWLARLDLSSLQPLPTEHLDASLQRRINDLVWRVRFRDADGQPRWLPVLLMLEFQSQVDWFMALRVQSYAVRLYEDQWKDRRPGRQDRLPPILAVVVYNGPAAWKAATRLGDLVGEGTRPLASGQASGPAFTGDSYVLVDLKALPRLPKDNLVTLLAVTEGMEGPEDANEAVEEGVRLMEPEEPVWTTYLQLLRATLQATGIDLEELENRERIEEMIHSGKMRTTLQERFQAQRARLRAEGEERGLKRGLEQGEERGLKGQRQLLVRLAGRKFGLHTVEPVAGLLAMIDDQDRLQDIAEWIVDCDTGSDLLQRFRVRPSRSGSGVSHPVRKLTCGWSGMPRIGLMPDR